MAKIKRITEIHVLNDLSVSFDCTSELYGITSAGGNAKQILDNGFCSLGDGCDYILTIEDKEEIKIKIKEIEG